MSSEDAAAEKERRRAQRLEAARLAVQAGAVGGGVTRVARVIERYLESGEVER